METEKKYSKYIMSNYGKAPITLVKGSGSYVQDSNGKKYLDFSTGIAVNALGHANEDLANTLFEQAKTLCHTSNLYRNIPQANLAEKICSYLNDQGKLLFCNSGTEANEAAIKLARLHGEKVSGVEGKKYKIISAKNCFHGRTFGGMSATWQEKIQKHFSPMLDGFIACEYNNLESLEEVFCDEVCGIILEPIQGESGITVAQKAFLEKARSLCDKFNALLIFDEVQTGIFRTGKFLCHQKSGVKADAVTMAKGLGAGFPIGALWAGEKASDLFTAGTHGCTFGGNPLACSVAIKNLEILDTFKNSINEKSKIVVQKLEILKQKFPLVIEEIRGQGFLLGMKISGDYIKLIASLRDNGLLCVPAGNNVVRILPPLNVNENELNEALEIIENTIKNEQS